MGLALCHSLPRDVAVQVCLLLFLVALILQAAAIGLHTRNDGGGYFTLKGTSSARSNALVLLAAHPATYIPPSSVLNTGTGTAATKLCNPSAAVLTYSCARFAESFHVVNGLTLSSFITNAITLVLSVFVLVRLSHSTQGLLFRLMYATCGPVVLQCAAVGCFFARTVPHARRDTAAAAGYGDGQIKFHRRPATNLMIAATALLCAGFVIVFSRWVSVICLRLHFEEHKEHTKEEVEQMTKAHMVNDDWTRQKQILLSHARSVQVEMAVKNPHKGDRFSASATARSGEPFPSQSIDTGVRAHRPGGLSDEEPDAGTLHFRAASSVTPLTGHASPGRGAAASSSGRKGSTAFEDADGRTSGIDQMPPPPLTQAGEGNEVVMSTNDTHPFSEAEAYDTRHGDSDPLTR
ncbi:hypothetical protein ABB37_05124 [Leptomonas pyrrhocoris]|uniref:Uncharacterized protein n=1 Tax=Leptomonas pyrrhocoris TaxID=157538 RepID=A0A0N1J4T2_LEPPY|nr:hypothetical protein ABB37_05124 [Leptomonas pyrrhocoris]XP_015658572.1 hypothetical protein ABB37_05124 [Leptomonas pyrrhocoris]XP_015658573.1 hypothetical protein ABB37_05124 [Leptomonas pyrrhocoris]KPA80132.1 hypothetical protein ABB37_05124 [Leptomonas pyrrhocoris]KPA80133.1 hypothetical protein ABB37_05124 [Leptomonas pyrrhocoris]KPA80134.1 hypothetical protein ABB37_05124 [Leptomonas pyrrhocoris]|eukprot:XP_015658571.1 hypothetical protein ABB37_05124 [Leptomonas pyrrhocoris]